MSSWLPLREVTLTEGGKKDLPGDFYAEVLGNKSRKFKIRIRNSDGTVSELAPCMADTTGLSLTPKSATVPSLDFWVLSVS
jgi:hypothetical protein